MEGNVLGAGSVEGGVREKKWGWYVCEGKSVEGGSRGWFGRGGMQVRSRVHTVCRGMEA